jgi:hypothetical protein
MVSATYQLFRTAILERKQVTCVYLGKNREVCPIVLGHAKGEEKCLTFQFAGESTSKLPPRGNWRCLELKKVSNVHLRNGPWREGDQHSRPQSCVEIVDVDVNIAATLKQS